MGKTRRPLHWDVHLSGRQLKLLGCAAMLCYTLAASVLRNGALQANRLEAAELLARIEASPSLTVTAAWASVLQLIGSLSIPVFALLLAEGFAHTSSFRRYLLATLICAAVSEVPYDLAMYGRAWSLEGQNAMFTCAICLLMLRGLGELSGRPGAAARLMQAIFVLAALLWCSLLRCAFGAVTVLLAAVYYLLRERRLQRVLLGCAVSAVYFPAPLSGLALWCYDGERGGVRYKYLYYAFYPLHLLALGLLALAIST